MENTPKKGKNRKKLKNKLRMLNEDRPKPKNLKPKKQKPEKARL